MIPLTYSFLSEFDRCPRKAWHRYINKTDWGPKEKTSQQKEGIGAHNAIMHSMKANAPLAGEYSRYEELVKPIRDYPCEFKLVEQKLAIMRDGSWCEYFAPDVFARGDLDVALVDGDKAVMVDWKTGKKKEDRFELELHALFLKANYRQIEHIKGFYYWLQEKSLGQAYNLSETSDMLRSLNERAAHLEILCQPRIGEWQASPNGLCKNYCDVVTCPHNGKYVKPDPFGSFKNDRFAH